MPRNPNIQNSKGKEVINEQNRAKRCRLNSTPCTQTSLVICETSNVDFCYSSSDDDVPVQLATALPTDSILKRPEFERGESSKVRKWSGEVAGYATFAPQQWDACNNSQQTVAYPMVSFEQVQAPQHTSNTSCISQQGEAKRDRERARRQSLTSEERKEINACRRARYQRLTPEARGEINARRRARTQNLTPEKREEINAHRRAHRNSLTQVERQRINAQRQERRQRLTSTERQEINAKRRAHRKSLPPEERRALLEKRKASYAARRDTPYKESIALQCPTDSLVGHTVSYSSSFSNPSTLVQTSSTSQGVIESIPEDVAEFPSSGDDDTTHRKDVISMQCQTIATVDNSPLDTNDIIYSYDDVNSNISDEEDDEYFIFAGRGDEVLP